MKKKRRGGEPTTQCERNGRAIFCRLPSAIWALVVVLFLTWACGLPPSAAASLGARHQPRAAASEHPLALPPVSAGKSELVPTPGRDATAMRLKEVPRDIYVVATADGRVYGVEGSTGEQLWSFHSGRALFSGSAQGAGAADDPMLIPGRDGSLYAYVTSTGMLQKLPSSVKDIVNNSPFLAADGTLFVGSKDSQIFTLDLASGGLASVHSSARGLSTQLVPARARPQAQAQTHEADEAAASSIHQLFVMRTDYTVRAIDHASGEERWNVTVSEFTSDALADTNITLMASLNPNGVHAVDLANGLRLWHLKVPSPVVSVYQVVYDDLMRRAFLRTLRTPFVISHKHFLHSVSSPDAGTDGVFIVEHEGRLLAFPDPEIVFPHDRMLAGADGVRYSLPTPDAAASPLLGDDPSTATQLVPLRQQLCDQRIIFDDDDDDDNDVDGQGGRRANASLVLDDGRVCLAQGLHFIERATQAPQASEPAERLVLENQNETVNDDAQAQGSAWERIGLMLDRLGIGLPSVFASGFTMLGMGLVFYLWITAQRISRGRQQPARDNKPAVAAANGTAGGKRGRRKASRAARKTSAPEFGRTKAVDVDDDDDGGGDDDDDEQDQQEQQQQDEKEEESGGGGEESDEGQEFGAGKARRTMSKKGAKGRSTPALLPSAERAASAAPSEDGVVRVGQLEIHINKVLGHGSSGTVVYEGVLHGRKVAVKRMLADFYQLAYREISLLLVADEHNHVVSYYAKEEDDQFIYLALSQCVTTLGGYIESSMRRARAGRPKASPAAAGPDRPLPPVTPEMKRMVRQMVDGLAHLHALDIVHRDLKPHNVLLDRNNCIKISDMGLAKKLDKDQSSFTASGGSKGTMGWQAPEILAAADEAEERADEGEDADPRKRIRVTKKVDIFSLGCLVYYILTGGLHPFGASYEREANIRKSQPTLHSSLSPEARDLVFSMIEPNPAKRPTAREVGLHPFFWSDSKKLLFLKDASDRLEIEKPTAQIVEEFEDHAYQRIIQRRDWMRVLDRKLIDDLGRYRKYNGLLVRDLLRVIRNKSHHHRDLAPEVRAALGELPGPFLSYFMSRFPYLLIVTYKHLKKYCLDEEAFKQYFAHDAEH